MIVVSTIKNGPDWLEIAMTVDESLPAVYREGLEWKFNSKVIYRKSYPRDKKWKSQ